MSKTKYMNVIMMENGAKVNVTLDEKLNESFMTKKNPIELFDSITGASIIYNPQKVIAILSTMVITDEETEETDDNDSKALIL